ncbi:MAG: hypothetical protein HY226_04580 [Candidatus Vogelbacteria bacterium]|nr:hypothetical protein [Candidatus Vogelbacteria bacterium]
MNKSIIKTIILTALAFLPFLSMAFSETTDGGQLTAEITPINPGPNTETYIHLVSYEVDLTRSYISWIINNTKQEEGIGKDSIKFVTGNVGKKVVLNIKVLTPDDKQIIKNISILPADINILWQSKGYTPPFYRGKSLVSGNSTVKLIAIPSIKNEAGQTINPAQLSYNWKVNYKDFKSGYGANSITINTGDLWENTISVDASEPNLGLVATKRIVLTPSKLKPLIYVTGPLSGPVYSNTIKDVLNMDNPETTIRIEPFFFDVQNNDPGKLDYEWYLNFSPITTKSNELTLRKPDLGGDSILNIRTIGVSQLNQTSLLVKF